MARAWGHELLQGQCAFGRLGDAAHAGGQGAQLVEQRPVEAVGVDDVEELACHVVRHRWPAPLLAPHRSGFAPFSARQP